MNEVEFFEQVFQTTGLTPANAVLNRGMAKEDRRAVTSDIVTLLRAAFRIYNKEQQCSKT